MGLVVGGVVAAGATAFAAADVAAVGLTIATAAEAIAAVGAVTSVIGTVTGNKDLSMAGSVLGVVGGVGALASSAGLLDGSSSLFGDSAGAAGNATGGIGETVDAPTPIESEDLPAAPANSLPGGTDVPDNISSASAGSNANPSGIINSTGAPVDPSAAALTGTDGAATPASSSALTATPVSDTTSTPLPGLTSSDSPTSIWNSDGQSGAGAESNAIANAPTTDLSGALPSFTTTDDSTLGQLMAFGKSNPMVAYGVVQAGGSLISGLTNPVTPAQIAALNAQAAANNAAAALSNQKLANANGTLPTATVSAANVTGKPLLSAPVPTAAPVAVPSTAPAGLINTSAVAQAPVTGAPAALTVGG